MSYKRHNVFHLASECNFEWIKNRVDFFKSQEGQNLIFDNIFVVDMKTYSGLFSSSNNARYVERSADGIRIQYFNSIGNYSRTQIPKNCYSYINYGDFGILVIFSEFSNGIGDKKFAITQIMSKFGELFDVKNHGYYTIIQPNSSYIYKYTPDQKFLKLSSFSQVISENTPSENPIITFEDELMTIYNSSLIKRILKKEIEYNPELTHFGSDLDFLIRAGIKLDIKRNYHIDNSRELVTQSDKCCGFFAKGKYYHPRVGKYISKGFRKLKSDMGKEFSDLPEMAYDTLTNLKGSSIDVFHDKTLEVGKIEINGKIFIFTPCGFSHPGSTVPLKQTIPFLVSKYINMIRLTLEKESIYKVLDKSSLNIFNSSEIYDITPLPYSLELENILLFRLKRLEFSSVFKFYFMNEDVDLHPDLFESKRDMYYFLIFWYYNFLFTLSKRKKVPIDNISNDYQGLLLNSLPYEKRMLTFLFDNNML